MVFTVPHTAETEQMIDAAAFAAMRPGAAFVNIGRGQVVDEQALIGLLLEHAIAGEVHVLDVDRTGLVIR